MSADGALPALPSAHAARRGRLELEFERCGAETRLSRQFVSYPFHLTRPFRLDAGIPSLTTLYQQSASGGLYRADDLRSRFRIGPGAAVHATTQAASIVHDCRGEPAVQETAIDVAADGFLAFTPDAQILLPGAALRSATTVSLGDGAVLLLQDSFSPCTPAGSTGAFALLASDVAVRRPGGALLLRDAFSISAADLAGGFAAGGFSVCSSFLLLGPSERLPSRESIMPPDIPGCIAGVSRLPGGLGWSVRLLAVSATAVRTASWHIFCASVHAAFGTPPAPRRK